MDTVQFIPATPLAATGAFQRPEASIAIGDVSGMAKRGIDLPVPSGFGQTAEVNKSRMADTMTGAEADLAPERVLKPWGLPMLPDLAKQEAEKEEAAELEEAEAQDAATTTEAQRGDAPVAAPEVPAPAMEVASPTPTADPAEPARDPYQSDPQPA